MDVNEVKVNELNAGVLAYLGDSVYEVMVRKYLVTKKLGNASLLDKEAIKYVSAINQARILEELISKGMFSDEELYTIKRARNYKPNSKPKNASIKDYKKATALEALFGVLYLKEDYERIEKLSKEILGD